MRLWLSSLLVVLLLGGCAAEQKASQPQAGGDANLERVVDDAVASNGGLAVIAQYDPDIRKELMDRAQSLYQPGNLPLVRERLREQAQDMYLPYITKYLRITSDEAAVAFGRSASRLLGLLLNESGFACTFTEAETGNFQGRPDVVRAARDLNAAHERVLIAALTAPKPPVDFKQFEPQIERMASDVTKRLGYDAATTDVDTPEGKRKACEVFVGLLDDALSYRTESAGPLLRAIYQGIK
jgi:hypothetical protein